MAEQVVICCPKCEWKPDGGSYWSCNCGHQWNTFETTGRCPNCKKLWEVTQCPGPDSPGGCGEWSAHIDWYKNLDLIVKEQVEKVLQVIEI